MQQDRHYTPGHDKQLLDDILASIATIDLHYNTLVDGLALTSKARWKCKVGAIFLLHRQQLCGNRLQLLDGATASFNVEVVVVALFLDPMKTLFELVLAVSNKARVFRGP